MDIAPFIAWKQLQFKMESTSAVIISTTNIGKCKNLPEHHLLVTEVLISYWEPINIFFIIEIF